MRSQILFPTAFILAFLFVAPLHAESLFVYQEDIEEKALAQVLKENPLGAEENIRSTLLHKTQETSIHLVQIRFKEKPHIHKTHDLLVILKRGHGVLHIGRDTVAMKAGDGVFIPRGVIHFFENTYDDVSVGLGIFTPPFGGKDMVPNNDKE